MAISNIPLQGTRMLVVTGKPVSSVTINANSWLDVETDAAIPSGYVGFLCQYASTVGLVPVNTFRSNSHLCVTVRNATSSNITLGTDKTIYFYVFVI